MLKSKPRSLNCLKFSDTGGSPVVTESHAITFYRMQDLEWFIQKRYLFWKELTGIDLVIAQDDNETLKDLEVERVVRLVAEYFKLSYTDMIGKSRKTKIVEARRFVVAICRGRKVQVDIIGNELRKDHSTVTHHMKKFKAFMENDHKYNARYNDIEEYVLTKLK